MPFHFLGINTSTLCRVIVKLSMTKQMFASPSCITTAAISALFPISVASSIVFSAIKSHSGLYSVKFLLSSRSRV